MPDDEELAFVPAGKAAEEIAALHGGLIAAQHKIAQYLRAGKIRSRARHVWNQNGRSIRSAWRAEKDPAKYSKTNFDGSWVYLKKGYWLASEDWFNDVVDWRWSSGRFAVSYRTVPSRKRKMMRGVELCRADIRKYIGKESREASAQGAPTKMDKWHRFWFTLLKLVVEKKLENSGVKTHHALVQAILNKTSRGLPDKKEMRLVAKKLWKRYHLKLETADAAEKVAEGNLSPQDSPPNHP